MIDTKILHATEENLEICKKEIISGGMVAFPTETVYGLAANAFDGQAVEKIFRAKGRPMDNPLIVHVHSDYDISTLVDDDMPYTKALREAFLPGALTMIYKSKGAVCREVSCGLDTVAIRVPCHEIAQKFLKYVNLPLAAPSANRSKHISPVTAEQVFEDMNGRIKYVLQGGKCSGGIESTVLDVTGEIPMILRSGLITKEMIRSVVGKCEDYVMKEGEQVRSPGMKYKHYSPDCKTFLFSAEEAQEAQKLYCELDKKGEKVYFLCDSNVGDTLIGRKLDLGRTGEEAACELYDKLHVAERVASVLIGVLPKEREGVWAGVINRMSRACRG